LSGLKSPAGSTGRRNPYEFLEGQPIDLQRYFYDRALDNRDDLGRMFGDKDFRGGMVASHITGFGDDCAYIVVETIANEHSLNVQLASSLDQLCPSWIDWHEGVDFMEIQRPLDVETIRLRVRGLLDNGKTATVTVELDLSTGSVVEVGQAFSQTQTLSDQLKLESQRLAAGNADLLQALAS